jgi:enoyl-[acyl-carrier-protein] reductase (NADH)
MSGLTIHDVSTISQQAEFSHVDHISDAVIYLASDLSRAVTATQLTVDICATKV